MKVVSKLAELPFRASQKKGAGLRQARKIESDHLVTSRPFALGMQTKCEYDAARSRTLLGCDTNVLFGARARTPQKCPGKLGDVEEYTTI